MARLRSNNVFGTLTDNPLTNVATVMNAAGLANLAAVTGTDVAVVTLDPNRVNGAPEIVYVTAHTAAATSATILRGQEGTAARQHPSGTFWTHSPTAVDHRPFSPPACRVTKAAAQLLVAGTDTAILFDTERYDTDAMHSTASLTTRITFNTAGVYGIGGCIRWQASATGYRYIMVRLNGTTPLAVVLQDIDSVIQHQQNVSTMYKFAAADYVELVAHHNNAGDLNVEKAANYSPEFWATWIGEG